MSIAKLRPEVCELAAYILRKVKRLFATAAYVELRPDILYRAMILFRNTNSRTIDYDWKRWVERSF